MSIADNLQRIRETLPADVTLVAVSKTKPNEAIEAAYAAGQRVFGENRVQEMAAKHEALPKDIEWHLIGHLQTNKVKYMAAFVSMVHAVESLKLLQEINKRALQHNRVIDCLLQVYIASEESKFGLSEEELIELINSEAFAQLQNVRIRGLMGMATNTSDEEVVSKEFQGLKALFEGLKAQQFADRSSFSILSMGMSGDYPLALAAGSNMVRVGSAIFGARA